MTQRGLPPSLDRLEFRRFQITLAAVGVVILLLVALVVSNDSFIFPSLSPEQIESGFEVHRNDGAKELAEAHTAIRRFVVQELAVRGARPIAWPGPSRHEGHLGWYHIEGHVEARVSGGARVTLLYSGRVILTQEGTWRSEGITLVHDGSPPRMEEGEEEGEEENVDPFSFPR
jgi:hypothetical protein